MCRHRRKRVAAYMDSAWPHRRAKSSRIMRRNRTIRRHLMTHVYNIELLTQRKDPTKHKHKHITMWVSVPAVCGQ